MIVSVTDAAGNRAYAVAEHLLVRPLPAPIRLRVESGLVRSQIATLTAEWGAPYRNTEQRADSFGIRWRNSGSGDWQFEHFRPDQPESWTFRHSWKVKTSAAGERLELQAAQLLHALDLQSPQALEWSRSALVITNVPPQNLQAEATHDSIFLQWGPHIDGLSLGARLFAVEGRGSRYSQRRWVDTGPLFSTQFTDLLPDTLYRIEVYLHDRDGWGYAREQHRFEIRTETAPHEWKRTMWSPADVAASFIGDVMEVTWTPPESGARFETTVCAEPPERAYARECQIVPAGKTYALLPLAQRVGGGSFVVTVETRTTPPGTAEVELHVPTYDPDLLTQGPAPDAPQFDAFRWGWHHEDPRPGSWTYVWDYQDGDLAEFSWREGDRPITRESRSGWISISTARGLVPDAVRMRLLRGGDWTPWSEQAHVPSVTRSLFPVRFVEYGDSLKLHWEAPADDTDVVGYRVYVARNEGAEEVLDVGRQTSMEMLLEPTDLVVAASVAALLDGSIEIGRSFTHWHRIDLPPDPLDLTLTAESSPCPPAEQASLTIMWSISGGVPPFTLSVDDRLGFETEQRRGSTVVDCRVGTDGLMQSIRGSVIDASRQEAGHLLGHRQVWRHWYDEGAEPFDVNLGLRNVYRDRVLVAWTGCRGRFLAVLRWRSEESEHWSYILDFPVTHHGDYWTCSGTLDGLAPLTTYEYQVARYVWPEQLLQPEGLQWTETQSVTTLGEPQELSIVQDGDTVVVSWQRQPDAWAYIVVLRSEDRSWWKRYEPNGDETETVSFAGVPLGTALGVELISPPLKDGEEEIPLGIDPGFSYGH
ncbi:MAG: fibronectin type III domain-containing protein [Chloroflexi bacterium]|nr:fibronectin type III domain-containing protein [Chloroflexota bacterium]